MRSPRGLAPVAGVDRVLVSGTRPLDIPLLLKQHAKLIGRPGRLVGVPRVHGAPKGCCCCFLLAALPEQVAEPDGSACLSSLFCPAVNGFSVFQVTAPLPDGSEGRSIRRT